MSTQEFFKYDTTNKPPHLNSYAPGHNQWRVPGRLTIESAKGTWGTTGISVKIPVKQISVGYNVNIKNNGLMPNAMKVPYKIPEPAKKVMRESFLTGNFMRVVDHWPGNGDASLYNNAPGPPRPGRKSGVDKFDRVDRYDQPPPSMSAAATPAAIPADVTPAPQIRNNTIAHQQIAVGGHAFQEPTLRPVQTEAETKEARWRQGMVQRNENFMQRNAFDAAMNAELPSAIPEALNAVNEAQHVQERQIVRREEEDLDEFGFARQPIPETVRRHLDMVEAMAPQKRQHDGDGTEYDRLAKRFMGHLPTPSRRKLRRALGRSLLEDMPYLNPTNMVVPNARLAISSSDVPKVIGKLLDFDTITNTAPKNLTSLQKQILQDHVEGAIFENKLNKRRIPVPPRKKIRKIAAPKEKYVKRKRYGNDEGSGATKEYTTAARRIQKKK